MLRKGNQNSGVCGKMARNGEVGDRSGIVSVMVKLILLIGLPASGKSSLSRSLAANGHSVIISTDAIRQDLFGDEIVQGPWLQVQAEVERQFRDAVSQIRQCHCSEAIYDATNVKRSYRKEAIALARHVGFTFITGVWVDTPLAVCLHRNRQRHRRVPDEVILRMDRQIHDAPPCLAEGLNDLICYTGTVPIQSFV